jgi:hypothetical protein
VQFDQTLKLQGIGFRVASANQRKSMSEIYLPLVSDDAKAAKGYMGHDEFAVVEGRLLRRFPVYMDRDTNAVPSGGVRQMQYKLKPGEARRTGNSNSTAWSSIEQRTGKAIGGAN